MMRVTPAGGEERTRNLMNRDQAREDLAALGVSEGDIRGMFEILDGNDPGTWVSLGLKDLEEITLEGNGWA
jgi:hypothetical protein